MKFLFLFVLNIVVNLLAITLFKEIMGKRGFSDWGIYLYCLFFLVSWFIMLGYLINDDKRESGFIVGIKLMKLWLLSMAPLVAIGVILGALS